MSLELVQRYEPVMRSQEGENFYPMNVRPYVNQCSLHSKKERPDLPAGWEAWPSLVVPPTCVHLEDLRMFSTNDYYLIYAAQDVEDEDELAKACVLWQRQRVRGVREEIEKLTVQAVKLGIKIQRVFAPQDLPPEVQKRALAQYGGPAVNPPAYYYRYKEMGGYQILQYWFFYAYNDFFTAHKGTNDHEADWEQITLFLVNGRPEWAAYARHDVKGEELRRPWKEVEKIGDPPTHPVVYTAIGSHASYYMPANSFTVSTPPMGTGYILAKGAKSTGTAGTICKRQNGWIIRGYGAISSTAGRAINC